MKTKKDIVDNWLPRYTGRELKDFSKYILLTNFEYYLELFSELYQVPIVGADKTMPNVSCNGITLVNFGMGSPNGRHHTGFTFGHRARSRAFYR